MIIFFQHVLYPVYHKAIFFPSLHLNITDIMVQVLFQTSKNNQCICGVKISQPIRHEFECCICLSVRKSFTVRVPCDRNRWRSCELGKLVIPLYIPQLSVHSSVHSFSQSSYMRHRCFFSMFNGSILVTTASDHILPLLSQQLGKYFPVSSAPSCVVVMVNLYCPLTSFGISQKPHLCAYL